MSYILSQPSSPCFSSMLDDIVVELNQETLNMTLQIVGGGNRITLLQDKLYKSPSGTFTIGDLPALLEPYAREYKQLRLECYFESGDTTFSIDPVSVMYAVADVGQSPSEFLENHFLTLLDGQKVTSLARTEWLSAYDPDLQAAEVTAEVRQPDGTYATLTGSLSYISTWGGISKYDVSPRKVIDAIGLVGGRLLAYTVTVGSRSQEFRCETEQILPEPSLLFVNSFGCEEFLHCAGTVKRSSKIDRQSSRFSGKLKNYNVREERQFTANTGWLNEAMADWATELFRSDEVYLWQDGARGKEVVITESKDEVSNEDDHMAAFEFTYTYAQHVQNVMRRKRMARIFSDTFEKIYN